MRQFAIGALLFLEVSHLLRDARPRVEREFGYFSDHVIFTHISAYSIVKEPAKNVSFQPSALRRKRLGEKLSAAC